MRDYLKKIRQNPMLFVFVLILLFIFPSTIGMVSESYKKAIVTAMAIDREGSDIEVSLMIFVPKSESGFAENYKVLIAKGPSLAMAIDSARLEVGKTIVFGHTSVIIVGYSVVAEQIGATLDYLVRNVSLSNDTFLIATEGKASDVLVAAHKLSSDSNLDFKEVIQNNGQFINAKSTAVEELYTSFYSPTKTTLFSTVTLSNSADMGVVVSSEEPNAIQDGGAGGSSGGTDSGNGGGDSGETGGGSEEGEQNGQGGKTGGGSGGGSNSQKQVLENNGRALVLREGKIVTQLSHENIEGINWISQHENQGTIYVENVSGDGFKNVSLAYILRDKKVRVRTSFVRGRPIIIFDISLKLHFDELSNFDEDDIEIDYEYSSTLLTEEVQIALERRVKSQFMASLKIAREHKTDFFNLYNYFARQSQGQWMKFLESLADPEDYLTHITVEINVLPIVT